MFYENKQIHYFVMEALVRVHVFVDYRLGRIDLPISRIQLKNSTRKSSGKQNTHPLELELRDTLKKGSKEKHR